jgi:hypothetical protein
VQRISPFRLMNTLFFGLGASAVYGLLGAVILFKLGGMSEVPAFLAAYTTSFKTLFSFGLILGTSLIVFRSQDVIPQTIEAAFADAQLSKTMYFSYKRRFQSPRRSITFAAEFIVVAFVMSSYCGFPLSRPAQVIMIIATCAQYALGVYVGRKLFYAGMMLHSLLAVPVTRNLFKDRELDDINAYVNIASTLTVIFVYVHVIGYYAGPFLYDSFLGQSIKPLLLVPALIATPVLLVFTFYPRAVLRKLYSQSIDCEIKSLRQALQNEKLSAFEKRSYLIEFGKMSRDELRYSLQLTLADVPIGITILIMVLQPLLGK